MRTCIVEIGVTLKFCCTFNSVKLLQKESTSWCIWLRNILCSGCVVYSLVCVCL